MQWQPIQDLPEDWQKLANPELPPLVIVWKEQAERLRNSGEFQTYMEKLRREIAIETGIIERLYTLDRGVTRLLIEQGINESLIPHGSTDRPVAEVIALIQDQKAAIESLFDFVGGRRILSTFYIKQLHQLLTQNQDSTEALIPSTGKIIQVSLIRGDWKKQPNNPMIKDSSVHEYCPPEQVASEMDRLIELHNQHNIDTPQPFRREDSSFTGSFTDLSLQKLGRYALPPHFLLHALALFVLLPHLYRWYSHIQGKNGLFQRVLFCQL